MSCPDNLKKRAQVLMTNGFGFQAPGSGEGDNFVICWCDELTEEQLARLKSLSGANTIKSDNYIGRGYLAVRWDEYNKITRILNVMLEMGCSFSTVTKLNVHFRSDEIYSPELEELKALQMYEKYEKDFGCIMPTLPDAALKIWNWKTPEGRAFCQKHRSRNHKKPPNLQSKGNYYLWPIFQNYDPTTLLDREVGSVEAIVVSVIPVRAPPDEDDESCLICFDRPADTMVMPCEHRVVCRSCSIGLRKTNDKQTCIRCRRPITHILE